MAEMNTIGSRIAKARKDMHMIQSDVADKLGVTFQAVSLWERDEAVPDTYNLIELAKVLGVSVSFLVEDHDYTFKTNEKIFDWDHMASFIRHTSRRPWALRSKPMKVRQEKNQMFLISTIR